MAEFQPSNELSYIDNASGGFIADQSDFWEENYRFPSLSMVSCFAYDNSRELLYAGYDSGHITSFCLENMDMSRYSSFRAADDVISHILPHTEGIFVVSPTHINFHSSGGVKLMSLAASDDIPTQSDSMFTCAALTRSSGQVMVMESMAETHIIAGTSSSTASLYDLMSPRQPVLTYDVQSPPSVMASSESGHFLGVGSVDGRVRLLDGRLRARRVERSLDAHTGNVLSMHFDDDDMTLTTCGLMGRAINPYDPRSPKTYGPDHVVRMFDLRMMCQLSPLPAQVPSPFYLSQVAQDPQQSEAPKKRYVVVSSDGDIQTCTGGDDASLDGQYANPSNEIAGLTAAAVSSSGDFLVVASGEEIIHFRRAFAGDGRAERVVNHHSIAVEHPGMGGGTPGAVPLPLATGSLGSIFMLTDGQVSSSAFKGCGGLRNRTLNTYSSAKLSDTFLESVTYMPGSFIGTAKRPKDVLPNSMLFGDAKRSTENKTYIIADPRKRHLVVNDDVEEDPEIPMHYRRVISHRGKQRMNQFDYKSLNSENMVGLENSLHNSRFMNATLQIMFLLPEVCAMSLSSQLSEYHHRKRTVWCELGFLTQNIIAIQDCSNKYPLIPRIALPVNFERTFKLIPEAVALNLFDLKDVTGSGGGKDSKGMSSAAIQNRIQTFSKFLLQHLQQEEDAEMKDNRAKGVIDNVFGFTVTTKKTYVHSDTQEVTTGTRLLGLEILYKENAAPKAVRTIEGKPVRPPFASVLLDSVKKETSVRGWCAASSSYEPVEQTRSFDAKAGSLPKVLMLSCGDTVRDVTKGTLESVKVVADNQHKTYWSQQNIIGGSWLPIDIEILTVRLEEGKLDEVIISELMSSPKAESDVPTGGKTDEGRASTAAAQWVICGGGGGGGGAGTDVGRISSRPYSEELESDSKYPPSAVVTVSRYRLFSVISQIVSNRRDWSHALVHTRTLEPIASDGSDDNNERWTLFNDFQVRSCSESEVTTFGAYRHPCLLYFARQDYRVQSVMGTPEQRAEGCTPVKIPDSVLKLPSLSAHVSLSSNMLKTQAGDLLAFDAEFVSVEVERSELSSSGHRVVSDEGRQVLARISLLSEDGKVILDDYILPSEPIVDYVTRFSGLTAEDLDPQRSKHAVVDSRTAYLKLRYLLDKGCIFVGHGLQKDFETANIFVPPEQIWDTVELWRLPAQRKISLRFLCGYLLKRQIQDEVHDSIEDAKTALDLYHHFQKVKEAGRDKLDKELEELYAYGTRNNWTLGLEESSKGE